MPNIATSRPRPSPGLAIVADRAARRREKRAEKDRVIGTRQLSEIESNAICMYPIMDVHGNIIRLKMNRLGAPTGLAHVPVYSSTHLDAKGKAYRVIHTEIRDLKAEVYAEKKKKRAKARKVEQRLAA